MIDKSSEIANKQQQIYQRTLDAFIQESKKTIEIERQLYLKYVNTQFAKINQNSNGGYQLSQNRQPTLPIHPTSVTTSKTLKIQ